MAANVCYFSKRCRFCQAFFEELSKTPYTKEIRFICVDPSPSRPPLPAWLKTVPALVVSDESEPRIGPNAVNNWLFERRLKEGNGGSGRAAGSSSVPSYTPIPQSNGGQRLPAAMSANAAADSKQGPPVLPGSDLSGPLAWHGAEMGGQNWSDKYSFLGDTFTAEKGMNPIIRNFEILGGGSGGGPHVGNTGGSGGGRSGGAGGGGGPPRSAKEDKLLREFEAFSKSRDMEFSGPRRIG